MGRVWLADDELLDRPVKQFLLHGFESAEMRASLGVALSAELKAKFCTPRS